MRKVDDLLRNLKEVIAHIDTSVALIEQADGPDRSLFEGYVGASVVRELRESRKGVVRARERVEQVAPARKERTA